MNIEEAKKKLKAYLNWEEINGFSKGPNDIAIETILNELEKENKVIDLILEEITDCEFEMKCSECTYECEKDYDQLYQCNKEYFYKKVEG